MAKKLLVADDSLTIQKVIKLALSGDGYEIQTVSDGTECLQQAALFRPDAILIDIGLPGRSAFDIKKAANEDPDLARIPFVLMSSAFEKVDEAKVGLLRFDGRLTKPFDPSNLKDVLTQAMKINAGHGVKDFTPPPPPKASASGSDGPDLFAEEDGDDRETTNEIQIPRPGASTSPFSIDSPDAPLDMGLDSLWTEGSPSSENDDSDIRHLTESTVKMSGGLDDLSAWNIAESAKNPNEAMPDIFDTGYSQDKNLPDFDPDEHSSVPMDPGLELTPPPKELLNDGVSFDSSPVPPPREANPNEARSSDMRTMIEKQVSQQLEDLVKTAVQEMIQGAVQNAVKSQLEQMAKKALPEIAERVVKQEIRKMLEDLSEPQ
jgi:two-component system cell cycle response regulator